MGAPVSGVCRQSNSLLPAGFRDFRNFHVGQTVVVCGCGASLNEFDHPEEFITIGVNDVGRKFDPTYLVVLNSRQQFKSDRFRYVEQSRARAIFTQLDLGIGHPHIVRFKLGQRGGVDFGDPNVLPYTRNSPYVALCLAVHMGAKKIGLIGVDFTEHHFFGQTGRHALSRDLEQIDGEYRRLAAVCAERGIEIVNLSERSRLRAFAKRPLQAFREAGADTTLPSLHIVSYATTPVAGVPAILARCINAKTRHHARCVWANNGYGNGVVFDGDLEWSSQPSAARAALEAADLVIVHNGKVDSCHAKLLAGKAVVTMAHNYAWNVDQQFVLKGFPGVVVGQYQATLPEFSAWSIVPNPVPWWEAAYQPEQKNERITVCYTPSGKHERYPEGHRLYWHGKGYQTTMRVLEQLSKRYPLDLNVIRDKQLSHRDVLAMKRQAHIVIDECVTGSYHRNSLEGLAAGCVVVNGVGMIPGVTEAFERCTGAKAGVPFVRASLDDLEPVLAGLIESGWGALTEQGEFNRAWVESHWNFDYQWGNLWMPVIEKALERKEAGRLLAMPRANMTQSGAKNLGMSKPRMEPSSQADDLRPQEVNRESAKMLGKNEQAIPLFWTCRGQRGNFGDMLSPLIVKALTDRPVRFSNDSPRLFVVGSLLKFATKNDVIWGSGFISDEDVCERDINIYAVRGPLTRRKLLRMGIECPEIYGDPGLLLPGIFQLPDVRRRGIGIIPHYVDYAHVRAHVRDSGIRIIDIRAGVQEVLRQAVQCEILLSSSLHGCVMGDAYGIPTVWVEISDKVIGTGFKFHDYYLGTAREPVCVDWKCAIDIDKAVHAALNQVPLQFNADELLRSFPYKLRLESYYAFSKNMEVLDKHIVQENRQQPASLSKNRGTVCMSQSETNAIPGHVDLGTNCDAADDPVGRVAIFCSGTENYVPYMVTTLRSFMLSNGEMPFDYYVLGHAFSEQSHDLLRRYGITIIDLDLRNVFRRNHLDRYPSECFWIFKGPELFYSMGYKFSLSVDGDIWCNRSLDLNWLPKVEHIAGIDRGCSVGEFLGKLGNYWKLRNIFRISDVAEKRTATNSGVLFYRNASLAKFGFFDAIVDLYNVSERGGIHRGGDDSTLALFMAAHPEVRLHVLAESWNLYRGMSHRFQLSPDKDKHRFDEANIIHLVGISQVLKQKSLPGSPEAPFIQRWCNLWEKTIGFEPQRNFSSVSIERQLSKVKRVNRAMTAYYPVLCYWYRGVQPNFGDEITPYLVSKIAQLPQGVKLRDRPTEPGKLSEPVLLSMGSVLRLSAQNAIVWGSGIRNIDQEVAKARKFCAVRGPLTRRRLVEQGYQCPEIYGDPALLMPRYFNPYVEKRYALGIIPHAVDYPYLSKHYAHNSDVMLINLATTNIEQIIRQVLSCHCTVSSALHGMVISIAYGIPTRWLKVSDNIKGDDSKFYDFFASLNPRVAECLDTATIKLPDRDISLEPFKPLQIEHYPISMQELIDKTFEYQIGLDLDALIKACPINKNGWKSDAL